jgi:hypothetical protein
MSENTKKRVKFETKLYRQALRKAEKDSFRQLLAANESDVPEEELSSEEIHRYKEQSSVAAARLVEKGASRASGTGAHSHSP